MIRTAIDWTSGVERGTSGAREGCTCAWPASKGLAAVGSTGQHRGAEGTGNSRRERPVRRLGVGVQEVGLARCCVHCRGPPRRQRLLRDDVGDPPARWSSSRRRRRLVGMVRGRGIPNHNLAPGRRRLDRAVRGQSTPSAVRGTHERWEHKTENANHLAYEKNFLLNQGYWEPGGGRIPEMMSVWMS